MSRNKSKYCTNPKTNRRIQIGGRMWRKMVKQGIIDEDSYEDPNTLYTVHEDEYENEEDMKKEVYRQKERLVKENTDKNRSPMVYKNRVVMGQNKLTHEETARRTADAAIDIIDDIQNNEKDIPSNMSRDEAHQFLQGLIFDKMLSQKKKFKNTRLQPKSRALITPKLKRSVSIIDKPGYVSRLAEPQRGLKQKLRPLKRVPKKKEKLYITDETDESDYTEEPDYDNYTESDYDSAYNEWQNSQESYPQSQIAQQQQKFTEEEEEEEEEEE